MAGHEVHRAIIDKIGILDRHLLLFRNLVSRYPNLFGSYGEWMRELGLGFTNPVGTGGVECWTCVCVVVAVVWVVQEGSG